MKKSLIIISLSIACSIISMLCIPQLCFSQPASWLEPFNARHQILVPNPCGEELTDYQVQVILDESFDFSGALADGSDLLVTGGDGLDCIPFWIETWSPETNHASIWVKVPSIPLTGSSIYLYYGNPIPDEPNPPELVEVGPIGPWEKQTTNIIPAGGPATGSSLLAENMVYDEVTGHYWLVFANYNDGSVGLAWTDDPDDPTSWTWHSSNPVVTSANAPNLIFHNGLWYLFYVDQTYPWGGRPISVSTSPNVGGPYTKITPPILAPTEPWEAARVDEPYVFQRSDGKWIMIYMGDAGSTTEQVGYAEADNILGPYTKFSGNPCLAFGPPGSYDAGTIADPWVIELNGVSYIGYTVSSTKSSPWRTALATTEDWQIFEKHGVMLDLGNSGDWDQNNAFRGAVTRIGDTYYFPYTGRMTGGYLMGMATMSAFQFVEEPTCNDPNQVFEFIDNFDSEVLDSDKWYKVGGSVAMGGGVCTLIGTPNDYIQMRATTAVGTGMLLETYASHIDAGLNPGSIEGNTAAEVGFKRSDLAFNNDLIRIMDWPDLEKYCVSYNSAGVVSSPMYQPTQVNFDSEWHTYRVFRNPTGTADFQMDDNPYESFGPTAVPTTQLYPWLMSYSRNTAAQSRFQVDWLRVRKWCGTDVLTSIGNVEYNSFNITGHVYENSTGVEGISLMLFDNLGDPYASFITDISGYYEFTDLPPGDYTVSISTPLGYLADFETQLISLTMADAEVDFYLSKMDIPMTQRGRGYWMHQVNSILTGKGKAHETLDDMCSYMEQVYSHFNNHYINPITIFNVDMNYECDIWLNALRDVISPRPKATMNEKAKAHLTALLLNMVSGKIAQWSVISEDGATVSQAITYCNQLITDTDLSNDEAAKDIAEMINEGQMVPPGWIDLVTPNYLYKTNVGTLPLSFELYQNYPNPFNPSTTIRFTLPNASKVKLEISNILGQKVETLVDKNLSAGDYSIEWDASSYSSGIYLYNIQTEENNTTKKMLLIK